MSDDEKVAQENPAVDNPEGEDKPAKKKGKVRAAFSMRRTGLHAMGWLEEHN